MTDQVLARPRTWIRVASKILLGDTACLSFRWLFFSKLCTDVVSLDGIELCPIVVAL